MSLSLVASVLMILMIGMYGVYCPPSVSIQDVEGTRKTQPEVTPELVAKVFAEVKRCTGDKFRLSDLQGRWTLAYFKPVENENLKSPVKAEFHLVGRGKGGDEIVGMVNDSKESIKLHYRLVQPETPTFLISETSQPDGQMVPIPVIVLANKPNTYFSTIQVPGQMLEEVAWNIFVKEGITHLNSRVIAHVTSVLNCLGVRAKKKNDPLLFSVNGF